MCKTPKWEYTVPPADLTMLMPSELPNWLLFMALGTKKGQGLIGTARHFQKAFSPRPAIPQAFPQRNC
jgi:hypothetical protein